MAEDVNGCCCVDDEQTVESGLCTAESDDGLSGVPGMMEGMK
ncbi:MAG: hypothetical protein SPE66_00765 [Bilifractor sp.]|nr:hypothetical protein [Bilifractor sp.]